MMININISISVALLLLVGVFSLGSENSHRTEVINRWTREAESENNIWKYTCRIPYEPFTLFRPTFRAVNPGDLERPLKECKRCRNC